MAIKFPVLFLGGILMFCGCTKQPVPVNIPAWVHYQDPYFKASFSYPQGWHIVSEAVKVNIYSSPDVVEKFYDPAGKGKIGIGLLVSYEKLDTIQTLDDYVASWKNDLTNSGYTIGSITARTVDGSPGTQVEYSGRIDENTKLSSARVITIKDSLLYNIQYRAFNELFAMNRWVLDTLVTSVRLYQPKPAVTASEQPKPSPEFEQFSNNFLQMSYPNNFEVSFPQLKGGALFSLELKGYRQDCTIRIDVLPAKGLPVEKVVEQNLKFYKPTSRGSTTIDESKTLSLNYSPAKSIESRAYFLVKNDRVYRMIINYYQPLKKDYLPAFEKTIASVHVK